jgi:hypothetical protein
MSTNGNEFAEIRAIRVKAFASVFIRVHPWLRVFLSASNCCGLDY